MPLQNIETVSELRDYAGTKGYEIVHARVRVNGYSLVSVRENKVVRYDVTLKQIVTFFEMGENHESML